MVTCIIVDSSRKEIGKFQPKGVKNLLDEAADEGIDLPFSCHAGACMSCAARIIEGAECIDQEGDGMKYIETDDDVFLTCIATVKKECVDDEKEYVVKIEILMD